MLFVYLCLLAVSKLGTSDKNMIHCAFVLAWFVFTLTNKKDLRGQKPAMGTAVVWKH